MPKCVDCFYHRRTAVVTDTPTAICFHPKVVDMDEVWHHMPEVARVIRGKEGACGPEGHLFHPKEGEPLPLHRFKN